MLVRIWRLVAVMLTSLGMGTALCHLLEMPAKIKLDGSLWLMLLQTLYPPAFGTIGAFFEVGAVVTTVVLAFLVRQRRPALDLESPKNKSVPKIFSTLASSATFDTVRRLRSFVQQPVRYF